MVQMSPEKSDSFYLYYGGFYQYYGTGKKRSLTSLNSSSVFKMLLTSEFAERFLRKGLYALQDAPAERELCFVCSGQVKSGYNLNSGEGLI